MRRQIGVPVVRPSNTPDRISTVSGSRRCVTWRDVPGRRRSSSCWMSLSASAMPGGQPSTTQPMAGPCDSPNEVKQNRVPKVLPDMSMMMPQSCMVTLAPGLVDALRNARRVAVLTGAGVSAESGVPTFRDAQTGLWAKYDPRELATPDAFARNPKLVWDWYAARRAMLAKVKPNPAHFAIAELERRVPQFLLATQNVDGLHQRAGSVAMVELHGNIARVKCSREGTLVAQWSEAQADEPPRCPACGAYLRPDVVWF